MSKHFLDASGLKCPKPVLKIAVKAADLNKGDTLEVVGDCPTFEKDVRKWCERLNKVLLAVIDEGGARKKVQILF